MQREGFSLMELLIVVGILVGLVAMSVPLLTQYLVRSDVSSAVQLEVQGISRARLLARTGYLADSWGFANSGVVFRGTSYAARDPQYDERYLIPVSVTASGIPEVIFSRLAANPSVSGSIVLTSYNVMKIVSVGAMY